MQLKNTLFGSLALGSAALLLAPPESEAFGLLGHQLNPNQRDFRIYNNFADTQTNNNTIEEDNFPGYTGAVLAIWKGCVEWGSGSHGDGTSGDHTQSNLGDGGANFDPSFQGENTQVDSGSGNTHSVLSGSSGGVFAFMTGGGSGWRIRYYDGWTWADGPIGIGGGAVDLQSVGCHEYGHALGLAHSSSGSATMFFATSPGTVSNRSINSDDAAGIQAIYGSADPNKPSITAVALNAAVTEVTVTGVNFSATGNEVWFTQKDKGGTGEPIKVVNLTSTAGGTLIVAPIPNEAGKGDLMVKTDIGGGKSLSNSWPFIGDGPPPAAPEVTSITPSQVASLLPTNSQSITVTGTNLDDVTDVLAGGVSVLEGGSFSFLGPDQLLIAMPPQGQLGMVTLEFVSPHGSDTADIEVVAPTGPVIRLGTGKSPEPLFSSVTTNIRVGGQPGNGLLLFWSNSDVPSCIPSTICLDIGNAFGELEFLKPFTAEPKGWNDFDVLTSGATTGTPFHFQVVEWDPVLQLVPPNVSNVASGTWFF